MKDNLKPIKDIRLPDIKTFSDLTAQMKQSGGYTAKKLGIASDILKDMLNDNRCFRILSFPASLIATGTRGIIKDLIKHKKFDAVITTCGTLDHDLARIWKNYYHGSFLLDDNKLHQDGINREGSILIPNECYGEVLEEHMQPILKKIYSTNKDISTYELVWEFGEALENEKLKEDSIVYWAWKNKIPVFIPGPTDGAFGSQIWLFWQNNHKDFNINILKDEEKLSELIFESERRGALMLGGGISKHHTIWWNQFKDGLDYAIYITTAPEWDGSLSGAPLREAVSWGKISEEARYVTIEGDVTVILPLLALSSF